MQSIDSPSPLLQSFGDPIRVASRFTKRFRTTRSGKIVTRKRFQATAKIRRLGDVPERTLLLPCSPTAVRGSEACPGEGGHLWGVESQWCNRLYRAGIPYGA